MKALSQLRFEMIRFVMQRAPRLQRLIRWVSDGLVQLILLPQVTLPPPADTHDPEDLIARTDELNTAAEAYFADYPNREFAINKPYSEPTYFPRYLFNLAILFHWLRVAPGDTVLELGAGSCWVSHFLNLYGCRTLCVDVSPTALDMGRELFQRDSRTRWELEPQLMPYDGHRLPLEDACCDRIVVHDAFHHIPNQAEVLGEMARVLREGGIVAMSEPGRLHSTSVDSQAEMAETGVLENDMIIEAFDLLARRSGFSQVSLIPANLNATIEIPAHDLSAFLRGKGFHHYWSRLCQGALAGHYIVLYKGSYVPTTRSPSLLRARIELLQLSGATSLRAAVGTPVKLRCRIRNEGDTRWLAASGSELGCARLGARLHTTGRTIDWYRANGLKSSQLLS